MINMMIKKGITDESRNTAVAIAAGAVTLSCVYEMYSCAKAVEAAQNTSESMASIQKLSNFVKENKM